MSYIYVTSVLEHSTIVLMSPQYCNCQEWCRGGLIASTVKICAEENFVPERSTVLLLEQQGFTVGMVNSLAEVAYRLQKSN